MFTNLFPSNVPEKNQKSLFGAPESQSQNPPKEEQIIFNSSIFNKDKSSIFSTENNPSNNIFLNQNNQNDNNENKAKNPFVNINSDKNENKTKTPFANIFSNKNENTTKTPFAKLFSDKNEKSSFNFQNDKHDASIFKEEVKDNTSKPLFGSELNKKESEAKAKKKEDIFININENNEKKPELKISWGNHSFQGCEGNFSFNLGLSGDKKEADEIFKNDNKKEEDKKEEEVKKEEDNKKEEKVKKEEDIKIMENNIKNNDINIGKSIFGTPIKDKISTNTPPKNIEKKEVKKEVVEINTGLNINNLENINNLSFSQRIEDNEEIQNALNNLYVSDILLPNISQSQSSFIINENVKNKNKKSRPIYFTLIVEIEGISDTNNDGFKMQCLSNEVMSNLMKKIKLLIKKIYKMKKELNDFEYNLIKNSKKLPINEKELVGDYIKNKDIIIVSVNHLHSDKNEEFKEDGQEEEDEQDEGNKDNKKPKKNLCPKDKLPILKRPGYYMNPNEYYISRMSVDEIKNIQNFEICNENGKIHFDETVSIYGVNFDKLFTIGHDLIEYEKGEWCHSPRGQNFNIPATITLFNISPNIDFSNENTKEQYILFLEEKCRKCLNGELLSYNFDKHELKYKIPYFY